MEEVVSVILVTVPILQIWVSESVVTDAHTCGLGTEKCFVDSAVGDEILPI